MTQAGYAIGVTRLGSNNVWSAEIAGQRIAKDVVAARVTTDKWAHVALTIAGKKASLFGHGSVIDTINLSKNYAVNPAATSLAIGASGYSFDEIRMFNKVRTADEIKQSMDKILSSTTPNLIGYLEFR